MTPAEAEVERLRQGLWDVYRILGFDTDGDPTPDAIVSDIVALVVEAAESFRQDYEDAQSALRAELDEAQLRSIEARNPGIDMDEVRASRAGME